MRMLRLVPLVAALFIAACTSDDGARSVTAPGSDGGRSTRLSPLGKGPGLLVIGGSANLSIPITGLDFGEVVRGSVSPQQIVTITNTGQAPVVMSGAGGAPPGDFNGVQDCQGQSLAVGSSCHMFFTYDPSDLGADTSFSIGTWNGQQFKIRMTGVGIDPQLLISTTALDFGDVQVGTTSAQATVSIKNFGLTPIVMSGAGGAPPGNFNGVQDCQGQTLQPGAVCHMFFTFAPTAPGSASSASIGTWNGVPFNIPMKGNGVLPPLLVSPSSIDFGQVVLNTTSAQRTVNITNQGTTPIVMSGAGGAPPGDFNGVQDCQGQTLQPGATCHMFFTFSPASLGSATSASIGTWNGVAFNVALTGTGVSQGTPPAAPVFIFVRALDFGSVQTGTTSPQQTVSIINVSGAPIVMSGAGGAPPGDFSGVQDCQGQTIQPGGECHMFFTFSPTTAGAATSASVGTWNGVAFNIPLKGNGIAPRFRFVAAGIDFGQVTVGTTSPQQTVNITNTGLAPVVMSGAGGAPPGDFNGVQDCQGTTLAVGATCHMFFTFAPTVAGPAASASIGSWNGQQFNIPMKGVAVGPKFVVTPNAYDFGRVTVGSTAPTQTTKVINTGLTPIVVSGAGGAPSDPEFGASQSCQGITLAPGASCAIFYDFTPASVGQLASSSKGTWNGVPFDVELAGTGVVLYTFTGFFGVDNFPALNLVPPGRPITFTFALGGNFGLDVLAAGSPASGVVSCHDNDPPATLEPAVAATHTPLTYYPDHDQYSFVWQTDPAWAGSCREFVLTLNDGSVVRARFGFFN